MVTTNDPELAGKVQSLRNHGSTGLPPATDEPHGPWTMARFDVLGYNLRLSDIQAAVGIAQMKKLDGLLSERRAAAHRYTDMLAGIKGLALPTTSGDVDGHTYQSYVIRVRDGGRARRNRIMAALAEAGVETRPGTHAVHRLGYYRDKYGLAPEAFPVAAACEDETVTLPIFPGMTALQQEYVVEKLKRAMDECP
jgi:dTDP-4-amino-4,6-dideoxygalactose transaminase